MTALEQLKLAVSDMAQQHILAAFGRGGIQPGSFTASLIKTIAIADSDNLARLRLGFPEYVDAVRAYQTGVDIDRYPIIRRVVVSECNDD